MSVPNKVLKPAVFLLCLIPFAALIWAIVYHPETFSADPYADITDRTGDWTLRFVLITLTMTPLRQISGWNGAIRFRRMLGLFAFFYGTVHFLSYVWFTVFFDLQKITDDVLKRPFITVGFRIRPDDSARDYVHKEMDFAPRWETVAVLHKAIYITGILGVIHYIWRVKSDIQNPLIYAILLTLLLGYRVWNKFRAVSVVR
jgi:sulfoxide reductase heme-binding subunit YedZ